MVKLFFIFLCLCIVLISCNPPDRTDKEIQQLYEYFDELAYLEEYNTEALIYENSITGQRVKNDSFLIEYNKTHDSHLAHDWSVRRKDSICISFDNENLILTHLFFMHGEMPVYLPYLSRKSNEIYLKSPKLISGGIELSQKDTILPNNKIDDIAGWEVNYLIPLSELENTDHLYFKGEEIKFR